MAARRLNPSFIPMARSFLSTPSVLARLGPCSNRYVHIRATPSTTALDGFLDLSEQTQSIPKLSGAGPFPAGMLAGGAGYPLFGRGGLIDSMRFLDVKFEVLGAPYSLLSVALPASSVLYSRRGTLVGVNGKAGNAVSTLSLLEPIRRSFLRIPFLYQKISSTSPLTCLISTNSPNTTFGVIELDGKADWMVTQNDALLAWTGHSISAKPSVSSRMSLAHWGNSKLTGRGLVALVGRGQIYQVTLKAGEEFTVHPGSLLAYSISTAFRPMPYRLRSASMRLQVPRLNVDRLLPQIGFIRVMRNSEVSKTITKAFFVFRAWLRRTIWGDRLFVRFRGPGTVLLQSRSARISDILRPHDVSEAATVEPGALEPLEHASGGAVGSVPKPSSKPLLPASSSAMDHNGLKVVTVKKDGKVEFEDSDFRDFARK
ncbi:unnamed protein product [Tuber melanosporum]|uniref:Altered inheritance of mitochondria protein 24, mitochondrial n=1 Tax=Tuber melanosporum (strain Mel28) TaxID=656061 RepID=D5GGP5_TUBMM|nr:uncharacterized protein GSTUM_00007454001 [Tuber melanosporum]CAZ83667.1 unnamed protein product [Tuber melanosporum]